METTRSDSVSVKPQAGKEGVGAFMPGDIVRQRHQRGAPERLVVSHTEDPDVVTVYDPDQDRLVNVLTWGHELVSPATPETEVEARAKASLHEGSPVGGVAPRKHT